ncbi:hypothetical protein [Streptomyces sp. HUAS TT7]|uniref:hypothetical protein n=1 Tax=Streptomyces sp. HUAS TT7 TaxID=3447507 RepID=UPI003F65AEA0
MDHLLHQHLIEVLEHRLQQFLTQAKCHNPHDGVSPTHGRMIGFTEILAQPIAAVRHHASHAVGDRCPRYAARDVVEMRRHETNSATPHGSFVGALRQ